MGVGAAHDGVDVGGGEACDLCDFLGAVLFHVFEADELLLEGSELLDGLVELAVALLGKECCLWRLIGEGVGKGVDIDGGAPVAEHGDAFVAEGVEAVAALVLDKAEAEASVPKAGEGLLHGIVGVGAVAQDLCCHAVHGGL